MFSSLTRLAAGLSMSVAVGLSLGHVHNASAKDNKQPTKQQQQHDPWKPPFEKSFPVAEKKLKMLLGDRLSVDRGDLETHGKEHSGFQLPRNPQAVVYPESTEEVSAIVKICNEHVVPIVPYTAGTSVEGHTLCPAGGITMDFRLMNKILAVNKEDMDCVVQPGVGWMVLNDHCKPFGMFLGVDPAPGACIGGMCATCASGTNAVRYGTMKEQVLNITVVLADGSIVKTAQRARKSSAGYDLTRLFIGSEGTLGIVTEVTLRLRHIPEVVSVARVSFDTVADAAAAVIRIQQEGVQLGAIELLDEVMVKACNAYSGLDLPLLPCVLFKFTGSRIHVDADIAQVGQITSQFTRHGYDWADTEEKAERLWTARKHAFWAAQAHAGAGKELMATDVAVPISRLAECIAETKKDLEASTLFAPIVGHVGDGNFHVCIMHNPNDPVEAAEAARLNSQMVLRGIAMGGTCTGEHGVGITKMKYLQIEKGPAAVELMKLLKRTLDPKNILNPGKVVDLSSK